MRNLAHRYAGRAEFLTIYIREAHPEDEWQMSSNEKENVCYAQPKTLAQPDALNGGAPIAAALNQ